MKEFSDKLYFIFFPSNSGVAEDNNYSKQRSIKQIPRTHTECLTDENGWSRIQFYSENPGDFGYPSITLKYSKNLGSTVNKQQSPVISHVKQKLD